VSSVSAPLEGPSDSVCLHNRLVRRLNELSDSTPVLVDLKPTGLHYMQDLAPAGGIPAVMRELRDVLHLDCETVTGETIAGRIESWPKWVDRTVIREMKDPVQPTGGLVVLFGSLAPGGAVLKRSAADPRLFERDGRCVVFGSLDDLAARIDDPDLDVTPDDFLVLQNAGPKSAAAMPEAGYLPIPKKTGAQRCQRHGPYLGCSDERDGVWYLSLARDTGCCFRGAARACPNRRPDSP
jgi:dihydroxy-acid dehydratase